LRQTGHRPGYNGAKEQCDDWSRSHKPSCLPEDNFSELQKVAKELPTNHVVCSIELAHLAETISFDMSYSPIKTLSQRLISASPPS
jgi:hypothetical protein